MKSFSLANLTEQDVDFLYRLSRGQAEAVAFWRTLGGTAALVMADLMLNGSTQIEFLPPAGLTLHEATLVRTEMQVVVARLGMTHGKGILRFLAAMIEWADERAGTRLSMN